MPTAIISAHGPMAVGGTRPHGCRGYIYRRPQWPFHHRQLFEIGTMPKCELSTHARMRTRTRTSTPVCACVQVRVHVRTHARTHTCMCTHTCRKCTGRETERQTERQRGTETERQRKREREYMHMETHAAPTFTHTCDGCGPTAAGDGIDRVTSQTLGILVMAY